MDLLKSLIGCGLFLEQNRISVTPDLSAVIISAHFVRTLDLLLIFCISAHSVADRQRKSTHWLEDMQAWKHWPNNSR